jgi:hypothetical protein
MTFNIKDAHAYVGMVRWQFAKTMPDIPHEYTLRKWSTGLDSVFDAFAQLIRT